MSSNSKSVASRKGKGKCTRDEEDKSGGGGRKRRNREVLQFFEDPAEEEHCDCGEDSDLNFEDFVDQDVKEQPAKAQNVSFLPKEEEMDKEEFDKSGGGDEDKCGGGGQKRRNREVPQFFEDVAEEENCDSGEDSDLTSDFEDFVDQDVKEQPAKAQNVSFLPKEEEMDKEEFDKSGEGDEDKSGGGGQKRRNREVTQFFENVAEEEDCDSGEDSDLTSDFEDFMNVKEQPAKDKNVSILPKEEEMDEGDEDKSGGGDEDKSGGGGRKRRNHEKGLDFTEEEDCDSGKDRDLNSDFEEETASTLPVRAAAFLAGGGQSFGPKGSFFGKVKDAFTSAKMKELKEKSNDFLDYMNRAQGAFKVVGGIIAACMYKTKEEREQKFNLTEKQLKFVEESMEEAEKQRKEKEEEERQEEERRKNEEEERRKKEDEEERVKNFLNLMVAARKNPRWRK